MILELFVGEHKHAIDVPDDFLKDANDFFEMVDKDLDKGYQMGRYWAESPTIEQRCQIAADRILTSLETNNSNTTTLMAAYILHKLPGIKAMHLTLEGDMTLYDIEMG